METFRDYPLRSVLTMGSEVGRGGTADPLPRGTCLLTCIPRSCGVVREVSAFTLASVCICVYVSYTVWETVGLRTRLVWLRLNKKLSWCCQPVRRV